MLAMSICRISMLGAESNFPDDDLTVRELTSRALERSKRADRSGFTFSGSACFGPRTARCVRFSFPGPVLALRSPLGRTSQPRTSSRASSAFTASELNYRGAKNANSKTFHAT